MQPITVYIASSFKHVHAVRLLSKELTRLGYALLDWTEQAKPPEGLNAQERRQWMDTDHGGVVYAFCAGACGRADVLLYLGESGQDAGVEVGMAKASNVPVLGIRGPLESPGLMLYGAVDLWIESIDEALNILARLPDVCDGRVDRRECLRQALRQYGRKNG